MDIVVLAGGLSTERDVSFKTGSMVAKALKENGHRVILLDVFMGYSDKEENLDGIFERADEISVKVSDIPEVAPDLAKVKASRKDQSDCFFGPNVINMCRMADIVFMALHGENGENGKIQAAFDLMGIKYTGPNSLGCALSMNKLVAKHQEGGNFKKEFIEKESDPLDEMKIVRTKHFGMKPMYPEDACVQMELCGHSFYVFTNAENGLTSVVYKRKGNTYGLIEPEF